MKQQVLYVFGWVTAGLLFLVFGFISGSMVFGISANTKIFLSKLPPYNAWLEYQNKKKAAFISEAKKKYQCPECNVIVLDIDILRADAFDCENNRDRTPFLCSLADKSIYFENHYAHNDLTKPSIESFLTSTYPISLGVWNEIYQRSSEVPSLLKVLQDSGINAYINENIDHNQIPKEGYILVDKERLSSKLASISSPQYMYYYYRGELHFPYLTWSATQSGSLKIVDERLSSQHSFAGLQKDTLVNDLRQYFTEEAFQKYPDLFAEPYKNRERLYELFTNSLRTRESQDLFVRNNWQLTADSFLSVVNPNNPKHLNLMKEEYISRLREIDPSISDFFKENQIDLGKTIVVLRSDHGEEFLDHGLIGHANNLYQELIRVPFFIYIPALEEKKTFAGLSQTVDEAPTLLDILDIKRPDQFQGISQLDSVVTGQQKRTYAIGQKGDEKSKVEYYIKGNKKLIIINPWEKRLDFEYYDLSTDPLENNNLYETHSLEALAMFDEYKKIVDGLPKYFSKKTIEVSEEKRQKMFEEGYF
jgi:arylsulfatase A-like enzyme